MTIDKKFIVNIKGKDAITYNGLRHMAHEKGLKSIETKILTFPDQTNNFTTIVHARVEMKDGGIFENIGDANKTNVSKMIEPHSIRMAGTRAIARCFRDCLNVDMVALEELSDDIQFEPTPEPVGTFARKGKENVVKQMVKERKESDTFFDDEKTGIEVDMDIPDATFDESIIDEEDWT